MTATLGSFAQRRRPSTPVLHELRLKERTLFGLLRRAAERFGARTYLSTDAGTYTYEDVLLHASTWAGRLAEANVGRGARVVAVLENSLDVVAAMYGTAYLGGIFVPLHPATRPKSLIEVIRQTQPSAIVINPNDPLITRAVDRATIPVLSPKTPNRALTLPDPPGVGSDLDPVMILYTSGSTGLPRGVVLTHDNVLFATEAINARLSYGSHDVVALTLPLSFDYGLYQLLLAADVGANVSLVPRRSSGPALPAFLDKSETTVLPIVPGQVSSLLKLFDRRPFALPHLRAITSTGAHLPAHHIRLLNEGLPDVSVYAMYGLTECKRACIRLPEEATEAPDSVGRALPATEVFIVDSAGALAAPGESGQIVVHGRNVAAGYWGAPSENALRFRGSDGLGRLLFTGDIGHVDESGFVYLHGREDGIVKHRGFRMSLYEVERAAYALDGVLEAVALYAHDSDQLSLHVRARKGCRRADVLDTLVDRLEPHKVPGVLKLVDDFPRLPTGKVDREKILHWR